MLLALNPPATSAGPSSGGFMRRFVISYSLIALSAIAVSFAQDTPQNSMASCTYTDGTSLTVRYSDANPSKKRELQNGKVWSPGDVPMLLFTETPVTVAGVQLAIGAYSMYVIPDKGKWTLIINKSIDAKAPYDEKQDLARAVMQTGQLPT